MSLTPVDRERITDSMLKIQAARATLGEVDPEKVPQADEIDSCLKSADHHLKTALGYTRPDARSGVKTVEPDDTLERT